VTTPVYALLDVVTGRIGLPSPQRGRGVGGEGDSNVVYQHPKHSAGSGAWSTAEPVDRVLAPSPLAPLPRWGEGNRGRLSFSGDEEFRHYVLRSSVGFTNPAMPRTLVLLLTCLLFSLAAPSVAARPMVLVAFGDSTTALRKNLEVYATLLEKELPAKGIQVKIHNAGVGGNSTHDARHRFQTDVLSRNPDVVILQFGINDSAIDVWKQPPADQPRVPLKQYEINLRYFITVLKKRGVNVLLMTPNPLRWTPRLKELYDKTPYEPENPDGMNHLLKLYTETVRKIARTEKVSLVDVAKAFENYAQDGHQSMDDLLLDGMHPNQQGHRLIAGLLSPRIVELSKESLGKTTVRKN